MGFGLFGFFLYYKNNSKWTKKETFTDSSRLEIVSEILIYLNINASEQVGIEASAAPLSK